MKFVHKKTIIIIYFINQSVDTYRPYTLPFKWQVIHVNGKKPQRRRVMKFP